LPQLIATQSLIFIAHQRQRLGCITVEFGPARQRIFAAMGDPDVFRRHISDRLGQFVPVRMIGDDQRQLDAALLGRCFTRIQPDAKQAIGSGKRRAQVSAKAEGGPTMMRPAKSFFFGASVVRAVLGVDRGGLQRPQIDAFGFIQIAEFGQRAMDEDRRIVSGLPDQLDDPLRLAQRVGADQMRAGRKLPQAT
jgi:hypothetical protein